MRRRTRCRAIVLGQQGNLSAALPHLQRATILRPESSEARYNLGAALWYSGAREKAIAELRESVRLDPGSAGGHAFLGMALLETGDLPGARASLQRAMALSPPWRPLTSISAIVFLRAGSLEKGLGQLEAGLNVPSPVPPTPDWDAAIAALRQALAPSGTAAGDARSAATCSGSCSGGRARPATTWRRRFARPSASVPTTPKPTTTSDSCSFSPGNDEEGIAALREAVRLAPGLRGGPRRISARR